jgi:flagella basal body P-ring formation protein FlgA
MRRMHIGFYWSSGVFALAVLLFGFDSVSGQARTTIRVSPDNTVETDRFILGDISQISGESTRSKRLRSISLGYAPNVGMTREISRGQIVLAINASGFSEKEVVLDTPETILVHRAAQDVSQDQIREAVESAVFGQFATEKISAKIVRLDVPGRIQIPTGTLEIRVNVSGVHNLFARFPLPIEIRVSNKTIRTFAATVEVEAYADVFVAAKDLHANAKIGQADVRLEKRRLERPLTCYLRDVQQLRGGILLKDIRNGSEIMTDSFVAGVVIRFGDSLRVETRSGNLKIIIKGEARASGKIGDRIAVKNSQSGAILQAVVLDEGLVKVTF